MSERAQGHEGGQRGEQGVPGAARLALAEYLRQVKQDSALSYTRLESMIPYSRSALARYVNDPALPPLDAVVALAQACGAEPGPVTGLWNRAQAEQDAATPAPPARSTPPEPPFPPAARRAGTRRRAVWTAAAAAAVLALGAFLLELGASPGVTGGPRLAAGPGQSGSRAASSSPGAATPPAASATAIAPASATALSRASSPPPASSPAGRAGSSSAPALSGGGRGATRPATSPAPSHSSPSPSVSARASVTASASVTAASWSGTVEVSNLDLDTVPPTANDNAAWSVDETPDLKLISSSGPKLAPWTGSGRPGESACRDAVATQGVDTLAIAAGDTVCVETLAGHYAALEITSVTTQTAMAQAQVWP